MTKTKNKIFSMILCLAMILCSFNFSMLPSNATAAGTYTSKTWSQIGNSGLASVEGYYPGTTDTYCSEYVKAAANQKYGLSITYPGGTVGNQRSWLATYAEYVCSGTRGNPNTGDIKPGDIVVFQASNGNWCHTAIVGDGGVLYHGGCGSAGYVTPCSAYYSGLTFTVASWMDANISSGSGIDSASYEAYRFLASTGKGKIHKTRDTAYDNLDYLGCGTYSLAGAQYGVYASNEYAQTDSNRITTLTTDANGDTGEATLNPGTYYIKELKPSPGYIKDQNVHAVSITAGTTTTWNVSEIPGDDPFDLIIKQNKEDPGSNQDLSGALFTVKYYAVDSATYTSAASVKTLTPTRTWVLKTTKVTDKDSPEYGKSVAYFNDGSITSRPNCLVKGETFDGVTYNSDDMYHAVIGDPTIPIGVYTVEETLAPEGFVKDDTVLYGKVIYDEAKNKITEVLSGGYEDFDVDASFKDITVKDKMQAVTLTLMKKDSKTKTSVAQGYASLAGAEYDVFYEKDNSGKDVKVGHVVTEADGKAKLEHDLEGKDLPAGTYYFVETKPSPGYMLNPDRTYIHARTNVRNIAYVNNDVDTYEEVRKTKIDKVDFKTDRGLKGAQLELWSDATGLLVESWTSDGKPHEIIGLPVGTYTLKEILSAPGYSYAEDMKIEIKVDETNKLFVMKDKPTVVEVSKINVNDNPVEGAVLQIIDPDKIDVSSVETAEEYAEALDAAAVKVNEVTEWTTDGKPFVITKQLIADKTYLLNEKTAPNGYVKADPVQFKVNHDATTTIVSMTDGEFCTTAQDSVTLSHTGAAIEEGLLTDTIHYKGISKGLEYKAVATLVDEDGNVIKQKEVEEEESMQVPDPDNEESFIEKIITVIRKVLNIEEGVPVTAEKVFTPEEKNGDVTVEFDALDFSEMQGKSVIVFEKLYRVVDLGNGLKLDVLVGTHEDLKDKDQTIDFADLHTNAVGKDTETRNLLAEKEQVIVDTVSYINLTPGDNYTVQGTLMDKETEEPLLDEEENPIVSEVEFVPDERDGTVEVEFVIDASKLAGKDIVVFEDLFFDATIIAKHADIDDEDQTIEVAKLGTKAGIYSRTFVDTVSYENLIPGLEYEIRGTLMDKATGKSTGLTASTKFKASKADGQEALKFDVSKEEGKTLVAFEELYCNGKLIAKHCDINDVNQTATVPVTPKTGDDNNLINYILLTLIAFFALAEMLVRERLRHK